MVVFSYCCENTKIEVELSRIGVSDYISFFKKWKGFMAEQLILVDTLSLLYRGHYAMLRHPLVGSDGTVTSGLNFLLNELVALTEKYPNSSIVAVSDAPGACFRKNIYPEYKANRPPTPIELREQTQLAREIIPLLGIPFIEKSGLEADDIIAGLSVESDLPVIILSPDKDLLQLVTENVSVLRPGKFGRSSTLVKYGEVAEVMGVPAKYVADFLAIMGDSSDNIPGAKGIGKKGAAQLINQLGSIEDIYARISEVTSKSVRSKLEASKELVLLSYSLTDLSGKLPDDLMGINFDRKAVNQESLKPYVTRLSLNKIAEKFDVPKEENESDFVEEFTCKVNIVYSMDEIRLPGTGPVCIDTETTSLDPLKAKLIGFSLCSDSTESWYIPFLENKNQKKILTDLSKLLISRGFVAQNAKYDSRVLLNYGIVLPVPAADTYLADYILRPDARSHSLKKIVPLWLNKTMKTYAEVADNEGSLIEVPVEEVAEYCCNDSASTYALNKKMDEKFRTDSSMNYIYKNVELPLSSVLAAMENTGIGLNREVLFKENDAISKRIFELMEIATNQAGEFINFSSPKQVASLLFDKLGLKPVRKTSKGTRSTDINVLLKLRNEHPVIETLIEFRELAKLQNTYVKKLPAYINPDTGLIHTNYNQAGTGTGRLSSNNPNLQNIPIRTARGKKIRKCFIPPIPGHLFITADYSQIELRVLAHLAGDGALRAAYRNEADLHSITSIALFGDSLPENRQKAKQVNFSIIYGISAYGLSSRLSVSMGEASGIISKYFDKYPEVKEFRDKTIQYAAEKGETRTILGRKRIFTGSSGASGNAKKQLERAAVNSVVQGSAADIIKLAMINVKKRLDAELPAAKLVLQVHDELVVSAPIAELDTAKLILKEEMENAFNLEVPLTVETGSGYNWLEAGH